MKKFSTGAKVNLSLAVTGRRGGLHTLDMRVCTLSLFDSAEIVRGDGERFVFLAEPKGFVRAKFLPLLDEIYLKLQARFGGEPRFLLEKHIPSGKGMGGSSALAASMALAWAEECGGRVDAELALSLGSDVPYMLTGGEARVTGRGEDVTHLPYVAREALVLLPKGGVDTAEAYALYDRMKEEGSLPERRGEYFNDLYAPAARLCPDVGRAVRALEESGAENAVMTGSGSAVCAFFEDKEELARVAERVGGEFDRLILRTLPARGE